MPSREPLRTTAEVSTPYRRSSATHASPIALAGITEQYPTSQPNLASATATFASPPPKVASSSGLWKNRSRPGGLRRSMISPKVMYFAMSFLPLDAGLRCALALQKVDRESRHLGVEVDGD